MRICNKCKIPTDSYYSLKGTQLAAGRLGIAFKYCYKCFNDLKILIADYIKVEPDTDKSSCCCAHLIGGKCERIIK